MAKKQGLWVVARHEPYFRNGFEMKKAGVGFALEALTEQQIERFKSDPHMVVSEVEFDDDEDDAQAAVEAAAKEAADKVAAEAAAADTVKNGKKAK